MNEMLKSIDIKKEERELFGAFEHCLARVSDNSFLELFAREKIKHSMQVVGAGNYILKNEKIFQHRSEEYLKLGKLVNLFHDIGRFREIECMYEDASRSYNHGFFSYEMLKERGYSDPRLLLPVKQHGNLADALEKDVEFQKIGDAGIKKEVEELYGLVKDADKIANLYIAKTDRRIFKDLFFDGLTEENKHAPVSAKVLEAMENKCLVKSGDCVSFSDRLLQILCFVFEIYYKPSLTFVFKHCLLENIAAVMRIYNPDQSLQDYIEQKIFTHVRSRYEAM